MASAQEWLEDMSRATVRRSIVEALKTLSLDQEIGTMELVCLLWPVDDIHGAEEVAGFNKLSDLVMRAAKELPGYCHHDETQPRRWMGRTVYPWRWHARRGNAPEAAQAVCPTCGQPITHS